MKRPNCHVKNLWFRNAMPSYLFCSHQCFIAPKKIHFTYHKLQFFVIVFIALIFVQFDSIIIVHLRHYVVQYLQFIKNKKFARRGFILSWSNGVA
jgi:hypothetical protein